MAEIQTGSEGYVLRCGGVSSSWGNGEIASSGQRFCNGCAAVAAALVAAQRLQQDANSSEEIVSFRVPEKGHGRL